jgi:hypothetical protein
MSEQKNPSKATDRHPVDPALLLEQYKAYLSDLGNMGTRFNSMTTYYVSIISALLALLALKEKVLADIDSAVLYLVCAAGLTVCLLWGVTIAYFRNIFRAKFAVLAQMEAGLPFQPFCTEYETLKRFRVTAWFRIERFVPVVFGAFFIVVAGLRIAPSLMAWGA